MIEHYNKLSIECSFDLININWTQSVCKLDFRPNHYWNLIDQLLELKTNIKRENQGYTYL
jgi:hypothetical protein